MELFLNIAWLALALIATGYFGVQWHRAGRGRHNEGATWRKCVALCCVLVLLFFVISLTDDLHPELSNFEDGSSSRRALVVWTCAQTAHFTNNVVHVAGAFIPPSSANERFAWSRTDICDNELFRPGAVAVIILPSRAPPYLLL